MHVEWGAVVAVVVLPLIVAVYFVGLAMNVNRYEWATGVIAKIINSIRTVLPGGTHFRRHDDSDDWRTWLRSGR